LIFLRFFKLAFQAALYYRLIPRASFNEYQACGLSIHFHLPWANLSWPFRPHSQDWTKSKLIALKTAELISKKLACEDGKTIEAQPCPGQSPLSGDWRNLIRFTKAIPYLAGTELCIKSRSLSGRLFRLKAEDY
jgi:hypothetical protein